MKTNYTLKTCNVNGEVFLHKMAKQEKDTYLHGLTENVIDYLYTYMDIIRVEIYYRNRRIFSVYK